MEQSIDNNINETTQPDSTVTQTDEESGKPNLPSVPEPITDQKYKPSGIYTGQSLILMAGLGSPAGILISIISIPIAALALGVIAVAFGGWGWVGSLLASISTILGGLYLLATAIPILLPLLIALVAFPFAYPAVVGVVIGQATWGLGKKGKCRNPGWAATISFINGVIGSVGWLYLVILFGRMANPETFDTGIGCLYAFMAVFGLIVAIASAISTHTEVNDNPFCEGCQEWYGEKIEDTFTTASAEPLIQALESNQSQALENITQVSKETYPHLTFGLRKCPACEVSDFHLVVDVAWEEKTIKKDKTKIKQKSETWITTMVSVELGKQLEKLLSTP